MTVKTAVSFTDRHHEYAKRKVHEGASASVSSVVAQGIEKLIQDENERDAALVAMSDAIKARMQTPRCEFIAMDESDTLFDDVRARLKSDG